ncbi:hypothetical protein J6590_103824 [Homalodisca vitripennis]|nr:hypothetical protein J6590_103824 [Homalodisca vitripennis]
MIHTNITQEVNNDIYRQSMRQWNPPHPRPNHDRNANDRTKSLIIAYHLLCDAVGQANDFYSDLLMGSIFHSFLRVTSCLYFLFIHLVVKDIVGIITPFILALSSTCYLCMIVSLSSDVPRAARDTTLVISKLITNPNLNPGLRKQLYSFFLQLSKKHLEFSAGGFFHVNRQMLTSMAATVATNLSESEETGHGAGVSLGPGPGTGGRRELFGSPQLSSAELQQQEQMFVSFALFTNCDACILSSVEDDEVL